MRYKTNRCSVLELAFAALAGLALVAGCSKPPTLVGEGDRLQILHKGNKSDPQELDPHIVQGVPEHHILQALLENLVTEDPTDLHPVPGQAESWDISPDGTTYTFHLRAGIRWSNGDPVTAHDFVRSYRRALTPSLGCEYAYMYFVMKGAEDYYKGKTQDFSSVGAQALDERTLRITLNGPVPYFLSLLNHYSWWPVHLPTIARYGDPYQSNNRWTRPGHFVGNGPFVLARCDVGNVIVENVTRGGQLPAYYFTPPDTVGYTSRSAIRYDPEGARKLLAQAGYPGGKGFPPFDILYNTSESHKAVAEAIQQMWKRELGIDARLLNQEWKVYLDTEKRKDYDVSRAGWIGDYADPSTFLETFLAESGNNRTGWANAEYDRLVKEASRLGDRETRYELFQKAEAIFLDEMPVIPIYHYTRVYLLRPEVRGWNATILDHHPYPYVWLAPRPEASLATASAAAQRP